VAYAHSWSVRRLVSDAAPVNFPSASFFYDLLGLGPCYGYVDQSGDMVE